MNIRGRMKGRIFWFITVVILITAVGLVFTTPPISSVPEKIADMQKVSAIPITIMDNVGNSLVYRFVDEEAGVVCYYNGYHAISCVPLISTRLNNRY